MASSILIVEDDLTFSTMLKTWLGKKGFEIETAGTQAKARKLLSPASSTLCYQTYAYPIKTD